MDTKISIDETLAKWTQITIDRMQEAIGKYKTGADNGDLIRSFTSELMRSGGNIDRVLIKFRQYGRFWDMRVGRGSPLGSNKHKKAPWYSKTKTREVAILRTILVQDYGINTLAELESAFNEPEIINVI